MPLTQAQLQELSSLVDQMQALPPVARAAWLADLPAPQELYRPTLERLINRDAKVETADFLCTLPKLDKFAEPNASALAAGEDIGPYRLIRELGHGGMGTVWLAERSDGVLKRTVALKLPHSALPQRQLAERFARERDILAALTHPNIARLYDAGVTSQGQPIWRWSTSKASRCWPPATAANWDCANASNSTCRCSPPCSMRTPNWWYTVT